jgi:predicted Zn-dependent protease
MGEFHRADEAWENAKTVRQPFPPELLISAATAAFNAGKTGDLQVIVERLDPDHDEYEKYQALLAFAYEEWGQVVEMLPEETEDPDLNLLRVQALIQELTEERVTESHSHLRRVADQASSPFLLHLLANASFLLLRGVLRNHFAPSDFDREIFIYQVRNWTIEAVKAYRQENTGATGYARSLMLAINVFDFLDEAKTVSKFQAELQSLEQEENAVSGPVASLDELSELEERGEISTAERLYREAIHFKSNGPKERVITKLWAALEVTIDESESELIADKLVSLLISSEDLEGVEKVLSRVTDLRSELRQLLQARLVTERQGENAALKFMKEAADEIPESRLILSNLTRNLVQHAYRQSGKHDDKAKDQEYASEALEYGNELVHVFPSPESYHLLAQAHWLNGNIEPAIDLIEKLEDRGYFPLRVRRLLAQCYLNQNNVPAAARTLSRATEEEKYEENWLLRNDAAALWGQYGDPDKAIELLEPIREEDIDSPAPYINLALAHRQRGNQEKDDFKTAIEVLELAREKAPEDSQITWLLYETSRLAGIPRKAGQYLREMTSGAPRVAVESANEVEEAFQEKGNVMLQFDDVEDIAEYIQRDQEASKTANRLLANSLLSYGDRFQIRGTAWASWFGWTHQFERQWNEGDASKPSVYAGWPTAADVVREEMMTLDDDRGLLLDKTALLTLGILEEGESILPDLTDSGLDLYLYPGALGWMQEEISDLRERRNLEGGRAYRDLADLLERSEAIVPIQTENLEEVPLPSELKDELGLESFDVEIADQVGGYYVSDIEERVEIIPEGISSKQLLRSLYEGGMIPRSQAERIAYEKPNIFGGWHEEEPIDLNGEDVLVFGRFALTDWFETGLLNSDGEFDSGRGPTFKVGPWAGREIKKEAEKTGILERGAEEAMDLHQTLLDLIDQGDIEELEIGHADKQPISSLNGEIRPLWSHTLKILSVASEHDLDVWADDRFLNLVTKPYGLFVGDQEIQAEAQKVHNRLEDVGILSTEQLLMYLSRAHEDEGLLQDPAEQGWNLVELGYRPLLLRLGLRHHLREYPYHEENPALPYQQLFRVLDTIHDWAPEDAHPKRKRDFSRLIASTIYPGLILEAWRGSSNEDVQVDERQSLATELLDKFEESIRHASDQFDEFTGVLWRSVQEKLARSEELDFEEKRTALKWLGREALASEREEHRSTIVRALEDDLLQAVSFVRREENEWTRQVPDEIDETEPPPEFAVQFALPRVIPLVETDLVNEFDPLIRRVIGFVAEQEVEGQISYILEGREGDEQEVQESEFEESALEIFRAGFAGDPEARDMLYAGGVEFNISDEDTFNTTLFRLLLRVKEEEISALLDTLEYQLINIDPALAVRIAQYRPHIQSRDEEERVRALKELSLDVLDSVYFQLRRDFSHAIKVLRKKRLEDLETFTGEVEVSPELVEHFEDFQISGVWRDGERGKQLIQPDMMRGIFLVGVDAVGTERLINQFRDEYRSVKRDDVLEALESSTGHVETSHNPLESGFSLFHVLSVDAANLEALHEEDRACIRKWLREKLPSIITADSRLCGQDTEAERPLYFDQRASHATAGRLAFHAISSEKHREEALAKFEGDEELAVAHLLFMAFRLQNQLLRVATGLMVAEGPGEMASRTRDLLQQAEEDLGGEIPPIEEQDLFNLTLYGPGRLDLWIASVLRVLNLIWEHSPKDENELPFWWSEELEHALEEWTTVPENDAEQVIREARETGIESRIGVQVSHTPQELAGALLWKAGEGELPDPWKV